tara:strand:- start:35 stop:286 length:252 start_codon:yes stop_codon:yes gene_type:complete
MAETRKVNNFQDRFNKLRIRMLAWADKNRFQTSRNSDFKIPDHPDRNKSFKEDLTLVCKFENHRELTRLKKIFLNHLWRTYKV